MQIKYEKLNWRKVSSEFPEDGVQEMIKERLIYFYNTNNNKLNVRGIDRCDYLPTIKAILKYINSETHSIENIYKFCGIPMSESYKKSYLNRHKYSYNEIKNIFDVNGCKLLSSEKDYEDVSSRVEYVCDCGNLSIVKVSEFISGHRCKKCGIEKQVAQRRNSFDKVLKLYQTHNCILLSKEYEYTNSESKLAYICSCKNVATCSYASFRVSGRCFKCSRQRGESHYEWKGGISPIHEHCRNLLSEWKKKSMIDCKYKCVITGKSFDVIHHLVPFNIILKEAVDNTNLKLLKNISDYSSSELKILSDEIISLHNKYNLGVCLNEKIHKLFHAEYSNRNNSIEQFGEFKERLKIGEFDDYLKLNNLNLAI